VFSAILIMVMGTTLITPPILKPLFNRTLTTDEPEAGVHVIHPGMKDLER
jgi:hypothetical protein